MPKRKQLTRAQELEQHAIQTLLMEAATDCLEKKDANDGHLPRGYMSSVLTRMGHPKLNRDMVNYQISKLEQARLNNNNSATTTPNQSHNDDVSALTSPSMFSNSSESSKRAKGGRPKKEEQLTHV